jgi:hypothetical protein
MLGVIFCDAVCVLLILVPCVNLRAMSYMLSSMSCDAVFNLSAMFYNAECCML